MMNKMFKKTLQKVYYNCNNNQNRLYNTNNKKFNNFNQDKYIQTIVQHENNYNK